MLVLILFLVGCAKFNTFYNAERNFNSAEQVREDAIRQHQDPPTPVGTQKSEYESAIRKAQKVLDEYPGHSLTDDALFLQAKSYYRLESYRMSIRKFDLLFTNFPQTPYLEEALYLTALDYLLIGALDRSQEYLDRLAKLYPESGFQAETRKVSGDNSFAQEDWELAAENYRAYLELDSKIEERDRVGLRLAECFWELDDYPSAAEVLQEVSNNTTSADLGFRAKLLRARVHVRMGDFEMADRLLLELQDEGSIYNAQGDVLLAEAESLVAQGKGDQASPLLENMPTEWETPAVMARASDMLGYLYLERGEWVEARTKFQTAIMKRDELDDDDRTRRLNENLQDYLAAETALPDAQASRIPGLKVLQANAMLFGFDQPGIAADLYIQAAADTAVDSTVAARALYGAFIAYDRYLEKPDSAAIFAQELEDKYPESPQAFEIRTNQDGDLLGYLLTRQRSEQQIRFANLSQEERDALISESDFTSTLTGGTAGMVGVRRRLVYLSRRANIMFEPPQVALQAAQAQQAQNFEAAAKSMEARTSADSLRALTAPGEVGTGVVAPPGEVTPAVTEETGVGEELQEGDGEAMEEDAATAKAAAEAKEKEEKEKEEDAKKKKKDENWDFLR